MLVSYAMLSQELSYAILAQTNYAILTWHHDKT